ncbi:MAG TPA: hypothetical protein VGK59_02610 [Ohtaekwangia sp.]
MIKIKQGYLLPFFIRFVGVIVFFGIILNYIRTDPGMRMMLMQAVTLYFCVMIVTARWFMVFDTDKKTCFRYVWVLGLKLGGTRSYNCIEKLFVNKVKYVSAGSMMNYHEKTQSVQYKCFLKFDDGEKILFDTDVDKERLFDRLRHSNRVLKTSIYDTTTHEAILVEQG